MFLRDIRQNPGQMTTGQIGFPGQNKIHKQSLPNQVNLLTGKTERSFISKMKTGIFSQEVVTNTTATVRKKATGEPKEVLEAEITLLEVAAAAIQVVEDPILVEAQAVVVQVEEGDNFKSVFFK
jgi:hypothetical protein